MSKKSKSGASDRVRAMRSVRSTGFKFMLAELPAAVQRRAQELFDNHFAKNPNDPVLCTEELFDSKKGRHRNGSKSVRVTLRYRAIYVVDRGADGKGPAQAFWYWIGSHESYNGFIGCTG